MSAETFWALTGGDPGNTHELRFRSNAEWCELRVPVEQSRRARRLYDTDDCSAGLVPRDGSRLGYGSCAWARIENGKSWQALLKFAGRVEPTLILREGESVRRTVIWALSVPLDIFRLERTNKRLAHALGAKKKWAEPAFMAHPPGAVLKLGRESKPLEVVVEHHGPESIVTPRDLVGRLVDPPAQKDWRAA